MPTEKIFEISLRAEGDLSGIFEHDGESGYFYLHDSRKEPGKQIIGSIHIVSGRPAFMGSDISVAWDAEGMFVGLSIRGQVWAAFRSIDGARYGGEYRESEDSRVPAQVAARFIHS